MSARRQWTRERVLSLGLHTDLVTAGEIVGIGRTTAHDLARRGEFPVKVLRLGRKYVVPVAPLLELLGINDGDAPADAA